MQHLDNLSNNNLNFIKTKTKEMIVSSYGTYNNNVFQLNISKGVFTALQNLVDSQDCRKYLK